MKKKLRSPAQGGFALLLVLIIVSFAAAIALLFLLGAQQERTGTNSYAQGSRARELADIPVNLVIGQINAATKQGTAANPVAWASQPGMIRTYDNTGALKNAFKLYSWNNLIEDGVGFNPNSEVSGDATKTEVPQANWDISPALYTDLNQPSASTTTVAGTTTYIYPIVDPAAQTQVEQDTGNGFFNIGKDVSTGYHKATSASSTNPVINEAPMPVQWLYVLQDGTLVGATGPTGTNTITLTNSLASVSNPIVGRIAFWTDDDTCKVNINTASEGAYWDYPKAATQDDIQFAGNPPVRGEYARIPGHPATTSLSAVFPEMRNGTFSRWAADGKSPATNYTTQLKDIFSIVPRVNWDTVHANAGSQGGVAPVNSIYGSSLYCPPLSLWSTVQQADISVNNDADRLYATADDIWFQPATAVGTRTANVFTSYGITPQMISQRLFFLTANSSAPETTLFGTPRVSLWPLTYPNYSSWAHPFNYNTTGGFGGRSSKPGASTTTGYGLTPDNIVSSGTQPWIQLAKTTPVCITPQEQLIAYASTMPSATTAVAVAGSIYYFQRKDPDSPVNDWLGISRNRDLANYLRSEMKNAMPGVGLSLQSKWGDNNTDWIALSCFDFSRSLINQYTYNPSLTTASTLLYSFAALPSEPNGCTVTPMRITPSTATGSFTGADQFVNQTGTYITQGAYPTLREVGIMFYATSRNEPSWPISGGGTSNNPADLIKADGNRIPFAGEWGNLIDTTHSRTTNIQAVMLLNFGQMNPNVESYQPVFWVKVTTTGNMQVNGANLNIGTTGGKSIQWSVYPGTGISNSVFDPLFYKQGNQAKFFTSVTGTPTIAGNATSYPSYYTLASGTVAVDPSGTTFLFSGAPIQVDIYAPYSSTVTTAFPPGPQYVLDIDPTNDPNQLVTSYVMDFSKWSGNLPTPLAPRWNVLQKGLTLTGSMPGRKYTAATGGVPMPNPFDTDTCPPVVNSGGTLVTVPNVTGAPPPIGWQVEIEPTLNYYSTTGSAIANDYMNSDVPDYGPNFATFTSTTTSGTTTYTKSGTYIGAITTSFGAVDTGYLPYLYAGVVRAPSTTTYLPGIESPAMTASATVGTYFSTDIRMRVRGMYMRSPMTDGKQFTVTVEGTGSTIDPFTASVNWWGVRAGTLITPYDTVISMVPDPTQGACGDPRLLGKGLYTTSDTGSWVKIKSVMVAANNVTSSPYDQTNPVHVFFNDLTTSSTYTPVTNYPVISTDSSGSTTISTSAITSRVVNDSSPRGGAAFPVRTTDGAQWHQLGWPGPSGFYGNEGPAVPQLTGYATIPTFGGGSNWMATNGSSKSGIVGFDGSGTNPSGLAPGNPVGLEGNALMAIDPNKDWTSMPGICADGGYVFRPDQEYLSLTNESNFTAGLVTPYFEEPYGSQLISGSFNTSAPLFMPNRQIPSPVILGTLPSDMGTGWQTLCFAPNPAAGSTHPGIGKAASVSATGAPYTSIPDHLLLDLFWMPVAEPYPISGQFATAGKVNLNYAMMPFPYIVRKTGLDAVMKSVWIYAMPFSGSDTTSTAALYKSFYYMATKWSDVHSRYPINVTETLKAFDAKFAAGDIFRVASQICDMFLYPNDPNTANSPVVNYDSANANIKGWWAKQTLTSDNGREEPYNAIYSRITTKSNSYTVHWRVQALQKVNNSTANANTWTDGYDRVLSEMRGSTQIERYLDPNATNIPDYAGTGLNTATPLSNFYKWRVNSETYFQPPP